MISLDLGGAAEDRTDAAKPPEVTVVPESNGLVLTPVKTGLRLVSASRGVRAMRSGGDNTPRDRLTASQLPEPRRGPDDHAEPAAADIPAADADIDSSSSPHSCHRSSRCTMPATAARWGRAPASRRAAISISARVRTLTPTAWARATLDDHPGGETVLRREVARLAANGHSYPVTPSYVQPHHTWPDGTSSLVWHHPATPRPRLTVEQVHGESILDIADPRHRRHRAADQIVTAITGTWPPELSQGP